MKRSDNNFDQIMLGAEPGFYLRTFGGKWKFVKEGLIRLYITYLTTKHHKSIFDEN